MLYKFSDITEETGPRLMQVSPDNKTLVFAHTYQVGSVTRTVFVDLKTKETKEVIKMFNMSSYFWVDNNLCVLESDINGLDSYIRICYGDNLENEYVFEYDTNNTNIYGDILGGKLSQNNIEELIGNGIALENIKNIDEKDLIDMLGERYGQQYDEGYSEQNYTLFSLGGNNKITPIALTYKTGFQKWESTIIMFSIKEKAEILPIYHSQNCYDYFTVNPKGNLVAFREYKKTSISAVNDDKIVIVNLY